MSTFIIRVLKAHAGAIRGQIEHVRTGERSAFTSAEQLLSFLQQMDATDSGTIVHEGEEASPSGGSADESVQGPRASASPPKGLPTRRRL